MEWLCQTGSNRGSQGSRTTLSATRQEVPKNIQKPYTLVTFDGMHQKIFEEVPSFFQARERSLMTSDIRVGRGSKIAPKMERYTVGQGR